MRSATPDFVNCIIGGGVVGLAIGARIAKRGVPSVIIERHAQVGQETSSRNSEVMHAGLYYKPDSLKTKLCIKGNRMLYEFCKEHNVPCKNVGKWIVAQVEKQRSYLNKLHEHCSKVGVPTRFVGQDELEDKEPDVRANSAVLESPNTGIIDSHTLMQTLLGQYEDAGGDLALQCTVSSISRTDHGYEISTSSKNGLDQSSFTAERVINAAGLGACHIANTVLPIEKHIPSYYTKGTYFSYSASHPKPSRLIYPCPEENFAGLGTHLTMDLSGRIRFGPDIEWTKDPTDLVAQESRLSGAYEAIKKYLPGIDRDALAPDYCGMRPKLTPQGTQDFVIRNEQGLPGWINLLGIESPGLTSCLAIAEYVEELIKS